MLDGIIKPKELCKYAKSLGMNAVGISDHGQLYGTIEFYKAAQEENIKSIFEVEAYITADEDNKVDQKTRDNNHLVLIAKNNDGLKELYKLISEANLNNFYYKPRVHIDKLRHTKNLICLSACLGSPIARGLEWDMENKTIKNTENAEYMIKYLAAAFPGNFYLELQDHRDSWEQVKYNEFLLDARGKYHLPYVITTDAHYLKKEDFETHKLVMAQQFKKTLEEYNNNDEMIYGSDHYIQTYEEMKASAGYLNCAESLANTQKIADECNVTIELNKSQMPSFNYKNAEDYEEFLKYKEQQKLNKWNKEKEECKHV